MREGLFLSQVRQKLGTIETRSAKTLKATMRAKTDETIIIRAWTKPSWMDAGCHAE